VDLSNANLRDRLVDPGDIIAEPWLVDWQGRVLSYAESSPIRRSA